MKRKNMFVVIAVAVILVLSISATQGELTNPYEDWIETKDLKNCSICLLASATYKISYHGDESLSQNDLLFYEAFFENGEFDSSSNTFKAFNTTETRDEDFEMVSKKECQITFDPGANNIKSFLFSEIITSSYSAGGEMLLTRIEYLIRGSGPHFPLVKKISYLMETESGWVEAFDTKNTSYILWESKQMSGCIKDIVMKGSTWEESKGKKATISTCELISYGFEGEFPYLEIFFNGYLPRLRDSKGNCSSFGGPYDTGIDVRLRQKFYEECKFEGEYDSKIFEDKDVSYAFNEWMNNTPRSEWEGTGLQCGYARELDTENDFFCAMRWHDKETEDYNPVRGKPGHQDWWNKQKIKVTANNISVILAPVDWGPHVDTNRVIDLSEKAIKTLGASTDTTIVEMCIVDSDTPLGLATNQ